MSDRGFDLVVDRLVLEGINLSPDQATALGVLVEAEVRRIIDGGRLTASRTTGEIDAHPIALSEPPDLRALARVLAERITDEALGGVSGHG